MAFAALSGLLSPGIPRRHSAITLHGAQRTAYHLIVLINTVANIP